MAKRFSLLDRALSFRYAFRGIATLARSEHNFWIHLLAAAIVIALGVYFEVSRDDWLWLSLAIFLVLSAEAFNTSIEKLADRVTGEQDPLIAQVKDLAAAGVLLAAGFALIVGAVVFLPFILAQQT